MKTNEFQFPHYEEVEGYIRRARLERSVYVGEAFASLVVAIARGLKTLGKRLAEGLDAENERRAIEADTFLRRAVGRY
jgi:hypothetical protein